MLLVRPAQPKVTLLCYPQTHLKPENTFRTFLWESREKKVEEILKTCELFMYGNIQYVPNSCWGNTLKTGTPEPSL
jgi:hypothetical protein